MRIDLSKNLQAVAPWELIITWEGNDYPTKRPSIGLIARLQSLKADGENIPFDAVAGLFESPAPDVNEWPADAIIASLNIYTAYFNQQSSKNSQSIAAMAAAAVDPNSQLPTGSSLS